MTTYTSISNALVAVGAKPFATTIQALRDNIVAQGEADTTVPAAQLPTVLLGTLSATGVGTQTLSSLVLTSYKMLIFVFRAIRCSNGSATLSIASDQCSPSIAANTNFFHGVLQLDLSNGTWASTVGVATSATASGSATSVWGGDSGYTTATTSVTISLSPGNFDGGSIRIYGVK